MTTSHQLFYQRVVERRVQLQEISQPTFVYRAVLYLNSATTWGKSLGIEGAPTIEYEASDHRAEDLVGPLCELEQFLDKIRADNIEVFEPAHKALTVGLNQEWRANVTTLVNHIRDAVQNAQIDEALREGIFRAVEKLQSEVNRNRTRLAAASEVWDTITDAIGKGAENLEPAVKLIERVRKRLGNAQLAEIEAEEHLQLPSPPEDE